MPIMDDLSTRKYHAPSEEISKIPSKSFFPSRMVIHEHLADKAGEHLDIRINVDNKAVSFATRKGLPTKGAPVLLIRQPDHVASFMDWSGAIPKGEYGAGKVTIKHDVPVIVSTDHDKINLSVSDGPLQGRFAIMKKDDNNWLAVRKNDLERHWSERPKYKESKEPDWNSASHVYAQKLDGAHFIAMINPNGISFTSQRKTKDGSLISREDNVPHLRDLRLPKEYHGMVLRGELWHDKGFNVLSGLLNSKPHNAVSGQQKDGLIRFAPFNIEVAGDHIKSLPYDEQMKLLKTMSNELPHFFDTPRISEKDHKNFYDQIVREGGEGVVITSKDHAERLKVKSRDDYDLRVTGFTQGLNKYQGNGIGAVKLEDGSGKDVGYVGSGLTDELRRDMFKRPDFYKGKLVKVTTRKSLKGMLREPVFLGMTIDKNEPDVVK